MTRVSALVVVVLLSMPLTACGSEGEPNASAEKSIPTKTDSTGPTATDQRCPESWCAYWSPAEVMSVELYPTFLDQVSKGFEIITAGANDPGPNISGITYKYDEALFGGEHYDTDAARHHDWLDALSREIGYVNDDLSYSETKHPRFVIRYEVTRIVEQRDDSTAVVEVVKSDTYQDFDAEGQERIIGNFKNLAMGSTTDYWLVSLRYEEGRALFKSLETLRNYAPSGE